MLKKSKRGDEKYYIMISLILGVMILAISLYFIFNEYFSQDEINWETCRQSVILRSGEGSYVAKKIQEGALPFKCKTELVDIKTIDKNIALKTIADTLTQCHYTYGEGKMQLYPSSLVFSEYKCFICARIKFDDSVKDSLSNLDVADYLLNNKVDDKQTYFDYIYWNRPSPVDKNTLIEQVKKESVFDAKNGDIFVVWYYSQARSSYFMALKFYQPDVTPKGLQTCKVIETLPA